MKSHSFLIAVIVGGEWPRLIPRRFNPGITPNIHCVGSLMVPTAHLHILEKRNSLAPAGIQTPNHPAVGLVTAPTTQYRLRSLFNNLKNIWRRFHV